MPARSRWLDDADDDDDDDDDDAPNGCVVGGASDRLGGVDEEGCSTIGEADDGDGPPLSRPGSEAHQIHDSDDDDIENADGGSSRSYQGPVSFAGLPMPAGKPCRSVDCYEKIHKIDEGAYGVVYKAKDRKTGDVVALKQVKLLSKQEGFPVTSLREINVLLSLSHPNIVNVREMVVGNTMDKIFMVMDFMDHDLKGLMSTMKQPFSASEVKRLMIDLMQALEYCHEHWVLHRDLKTSNLLMSNTGIVSLCDFGLARKYGEPLKHYTELVVTLWYRAPELLLGCKLYGPEIDVWSMGCIFAELVLREPLLPGKGELDQIDKIFKLLGVPTEASWPGVSDLPHMKKVQFKPQPFNHLRNKFKRGASFTSETALSDAGFDLLKSMLSLDPKQRITAKEALEHEYFSEQPPPKAHHLMPTYPSSHDRKGKQPKVRSVNEEEEEQRRIFHANR